MELIVGKKGKGKTKILLNKVNDVIKTSSGSVVYIDKSSKHMFELNNKIRLIDTSDFTLENVDAFIGFINGILSQDRDLDCIYLDSFLRVSRLEDESTNLHVALDALKTIGDKFNVTFVLSISADKQDIPEAYHENVVVAL